MFKQCRSFGQFESLGRVLIRDSRTITVVSAASGLCFNQREVREINSLSKQCAAAVSSKLFKLCKLFDVSRYSEESYSEDQAPSPSNGQLVLSKV